MKTSSAAMWWGLAAVVVAGLLFVPIVLSNADDAPNGFEGYVQSGTCADPSDEFKADLESDDNEYDVEPYVAVAADGDLVTLGYNGSPGVPGFGLAAIYTDQQFSLVIADADSDDAVACGDILRPDADQYEEAGVAVVQLLPVGSGDVGGLAVIQRTSLQRELDITPTRVRIVLSTEPISVAGEVADGYEGYVRGGYCDSEPGEYGSSSRARTTTTSCRSRHSPPTQVMPSPLRHTVSPAHRASVWPPPTRTRTSRW